MAEDVAKLAIVVGTRGVKESTKEMDALKASVKRLEGQLKSNKKTTKTSTAEQKKFTTAMGTFRSTLPAVASSVYLVQQAYQILSGAISTVTEAYEVQYGAEIKLQTILASNNNAIGLTVDQVNILAQTWQNLTGVNDAVILEAAAIGATFTQISKEVFPDVIEQALNMNAVFGQEMKQSMIQLGTAMNDPIRGLGRLRRIGISFSEDQKKLITSLAESGDVLGAQKEIIKELEFELGQVSRAMGESSLGTIKKYQTAWKNLGEEIGEGVTEIKAGVIEVLGLTEHVDKLVQLLANNNASNKFKGLIDRDQLAGDVSVAQTSAMEIQSAYDGFIRQVDRLSTTLTKERGRLFKDNNYISALEAEEAEYYTYIEALRLFSIEYQKAEDIKRASLTDGEDTGTTLADGAEAWLISLKRVEAQKSKILGLDKISAGFENKKFSRETQYRSLVKKGVELGYEKITIEGILNKFSTDFEASLVEQEKIARELLITEQKRKDIDLYGTDAQKKQQDFGAFQEDIWKAVKAGNIAWEQAIVLIREYDLTMEHISNNPFFEVDNNFLHILADQLGGAAKEGEILNDVLSSVADTLIGFASGAYIGAFESIGASMAGAGEETESFELKMLKMTQSALEAAGPMFFLAAARSVASDGKAGIPAAVAYLALAAASGFGAGYLDQAISNESDGSANGGVTSSTAINTTTLDFGTDVSASRSSAPNIQTNIINNTGAQVTARATVGNDGQILLETVIDKAVTATGNTYGLQKAGRNVR
jgi:hypothetical protein